MIKFYQDVSQNKKLTEGYLKQVKEVKNLYQQQFCLENTWTMIKTPTLFLMYFFELMGQYQSTVIETIRASVSDKTKDKDDIIN